LAWWQPQQWQDKVPEGQRSRGEGGTGEMGEPSMARLSQLSCRPCRRHPHQPGEQGVGPGSGGHTQQPRCALREGSVCMRECVWGMGGYWGPSEVDDIGGTGEPSGQPTCMHTTCAQGGIDTHGTPRGCPQSPSAEIQGLPRAGFPHTQQPSHPSPLAAQAADVQSVPTCRHTPERSPGPHTITLPHTRRVCASHTTHTHHTRPPL
jgi:hypothetical protein